MFNYNSWFEEAVEDLDFIVIDSVDNRYSINKHGLVHDHQLNRSVKPHRLGNHYYINLTVNGKPEKVNWSRIYLMAFSPMHIEYSTYAKALDVHIRDRSVIVPNLKNLIWLVPHGGVECIKYPGFYSIPGNPEILVSKEYRFIRYRNGQEINILYPKNGMTYPNVKIDPSNKVGTQSTRLVHRLVALAFIPVKGGREYFFVNHIDGNKCNFNVENLEWVSKYENNVHAIRNGLRTDAKRYKIYNVITKETKSFASGGLLSDFIGDKKGTVLTSIEQWKKHGYLKYKPWLILEEHEEIPDIDESVLKKVSPTASLIYKLEKECGEYKYYFGMSDLLAAIGMSRDEFKGYPRILSNEKINGYKITSYAEIDAPEESKKLIKRNTKGGSKPIPILIRDTRTNITTEYPSSEYFANLIGVKKKTMQRIANYNDNVYKHYHITYLRDKE